MPAVIAKKLLTFSLVSVPVTVMAATSTHRVPLHLVHAADGARVRQRRVCSADGQELAETDIARGYELPTGETLVLTPADLDALPTADTREIRVLGFLGADRIDPVHHDRAYYLGTSTPAAGRPYVLLREALRESGQVAVARTALRTRDSLVVIRVHGDILIMSTLFWPDEIRPAEGIAPAAVTVRREEIALARQLMDAYSEDFDLASESDEYTSALVRVVEARAAGLPDPLVPEARALPSAGAALDLMAILHASVEQAREEHPKAAAAGARKSTSAKKTAGGRAGTARHRARPGSP
ncbi:non-homologous end joining protein Ku [Kitasatospora indigofera]|uniref:non-homologous end joining protein Ku n=1 Tax=Kitasatospora indigofera TaxID=67307 RepID=UPI0036B4BB1C